MKKQWQIWLLFVGCLMAVFMAMSWLSLKTLRLDAMRETDRAETELARREAELQERISSALYRMDLKMLPLVAQEATRPHYFYQNFVDVVYPTQQPSSLTTQKGHSSTQVPWPSPLLFQSSELVLLYFQIDADDHITSPQLPEHEDLVAEYPFDESMLQQTRSRMLQAQELFAYQMLSREIPHALRNDSLWPSDPIQPNSPPLVAYNVPAVESLNNLLQSQSNEFSADWLGSKIEVQNFRGAQRVNEEFSQRRNSTQEFTQQSLANNGFNSSYGNRLGSDRGNQLILADPDTRLVDQLPETVTMQPIWLGDRLLLCRHVPGQGTEGQELSRFQCCWLNWEKIQTDLQAEVADLLPDVQFQALTPTTELKLGTALTTLPVQLIVDRPKLLAGLALQSQPVPTASVLPMSLLATWCSLGLAAVASAILLRGVLQLSERRAAFVSAVTHELRTPLTTFRMYSEMLADGMVPAEKQQQYANTLKVQADRLSQLVENVLQYARLERGPISIGNETITVNSLLQRFQTRLEERAADSHMQLIVDMESSLREQVLKTQPAAIEQILFNLVDNACKYARSSTDKRIVISVCRSAGRIQWSVQDFGPGVSAAERKRMFQPFQQSRHAMENAVPGVGLGLALCLRMAHSLGARLSIQDSSVGALFVLEL